MAIQTPTIAQKLDTISLDYGSALAESTYKQMGQQVNRLIDCVPIGTIMMFAINQPGVSAPNPNLWQLANGAEITNPDSPLRTIGINVRYTPNLVDRFIYGSTTGGAGAYGGEATTDVNFGDPGSATSSVPDPVVSSGSNIVGPYSPPHNHNFGTRSNIPPYYTAAFYLKIN
jgi:hypothetical protein